MIPEQLSPHFTRDEMECHHCGQCKVSTRLLAALEVLRSLGPEPIKVHDACRCSIHNKEVGGVPNSQHEFNEERYTEAADVEIIGLSLQQMFARALTVEPFANGGIGVYDGAPFIHVDVRQNGPARWGRIKGVYVGANQLVDTSHDVQA